ncbi:hypothetical protein N7478_006599 [Penicillium angulare]|uniref:uncharacterized protein n=1 Tax=Penicillium angulare TaxID=116970 RepID=UPI00253FEA01|nr:uncharacterized protein N7478_006599 [Penicillium angulare]KAJ5281227.1 hypothetical protein N7478_006599 [Penicillium angulare]
MTLVAYSDSEGSDAEPDNTPVPTVDKSKKSDSGAGFQVDRSNPRKIRVALPELKPEHPTDQDAEDGPARKKARLGAGGGAFSGFNSFLPAPKRAAEKKGPVATTRKVFSLKTGAAPGFDRQADAESKLGLPSDDAYDENDTDANIPAPGSLADPATASDSTPVPESAGEVKLQGNPMMFRPLSVARTQKKKKVTKSATSASTTTSNPLPTTEQPVKATPAPPPKPKVSLFSLPSGDSESRTEMPSAATGTYEPLVYTTETEAGPAFAPASAPDALYPNPSTTSASSSLNNIANDLNLSKSERRQLFGRNAPPVDSQILTFNTDKEYAHNQALAETELAGTQHQPVRTINTAGKHSLQQLVNVATSQKEALEESFATGRRNKKEAGAKYGW